MKILFWRMLAVTVIAACLVPSLVAVALASDDAKMDQINALALTDYSAMFQISMQADGAYADAIARKLFESWQADGETFFTQWMTCDEATRANVIGLIAYIYVQDSRQESTAATEADLDRQLAQARARVELLQALQDEIEKQKQESGWVQ